MILNKLSQNIINALKLCSDIAYQQNIKIYLIGGVVRDLLLNQKTVDIDVCLEFDAIEFANILKENNLAEILQIQPDLKTAKVQFAENVILDLASTRKEFYPKASYLPQIKEFNCPLKDDVLRRDFTINSLAVSLNKDNYGTIIDYLGGQDDLQKKQLRILHDKSFLDDPSRILRALKYSLRLNFELELNTKTLMQNYLANLPQNICYSRIMTEIKQIFEATPQIALNEFYKWNLEKLFRLNKIPNLTEASTELNITTGWFDYFACVFADLDKKNIGQIAQDLYFETWQKNILFDICELKNTQLSKNCMNIDIYNKFVNKSEDAICVYYALTQDKNALIYKQKLSEIKICINGNDLIKLGFNPSKQFKNILDNVLEEKLNNKLLTKEEEIEFVKSKFVV